MSLLGEAVRSSVLPCSFAILIPALIVIGLQRGQSRLQTVSAFFGVAALFAWLPFVVSTAAIDSRVGGALVLVTGVALLTRFDTGWTIGAGGGLVGAFAGATWVPCVGSEFGTILTRGVNEPLTALLPMAIYVLGVLVPIIGLLVLVTLVDPIRSALDRTGVAIAGRTVAAALVVIVVFDQYHVLLSELARRSTL